MHRVLPLLLVWSCAHEAPRPPAPKAPPPEVKPEPAQEPPPTCTVVTPQLTLAPLPPKELPPIGADDFVTLRRTSCFGSCPSYSVTVKASGHVVAVGDKHVAHLGPLEWDIDPAAAKRLLAELVRVRVTQLEPQLGAHITDLASAHLEGRLGARTFSIQSSGGGNTFAEQLSNDDAKAATRLSTLVDLVSEAETRVVGCTPAR